MVSQMVNSLKTAADSTIMTIYNHNVCVGQSTFAMFTCHVFSIARFPLVGIIFNIGNMPYVLTN